LRREARIDWIPVQSFEIARTETTIGQFRRFADADAGGVVTEAERAGDGIVKICDCRSFESTH
jgi:sulfatase modifying factor 1